MTVKATVRAMSGGLSIAVLGLLTLGLRADPIQLALEPTPTPTLKSIPKPALNPAPAPSIRLLRTGPETIALDSQILNDRDRMLQALDHSIRYLQTSNAARAYQRYPVLGVSRDRVLRSVRRFRALVQSAKSPEALQKQVNQEFSFYESSGKDGEGTVGFTGYFEPVYEASQTPTEIFRYPLYRQPRGFSRWSKPHPTRSMLEGADGLQASAGKLKNSELVWMRDRLEAFLVQVQGSARLNLTDGTQMAIGFDGNTDYPYVGIGRELVKDQKFTLQNLNLPTILQYFQTYPADLDEYLPRNNRFVFFRNTQGALATGSLGVPVTAGRSIATDKTRMPPGALALIVAELPDDRLQPQRMNRFVLDQDTGGAIIGPGRVDLFMGTGNLAKAKAGMVRSDGKLYYLLLK